MVDKPKKKGYDPIEVEAKVKDFWEKKKIFKSDIKDSTYSIDTPPPTVSGKMHIRSRVLIRTARFHRKIPKK